MPQPPEIREFIAAQTDEVLALILSIQRGEFGLSITADDQPDLRDVPGFYQQGLGNFWVALSPEGRVVGTISLKDIGRGQVALRKMFVAPDYRGAATGTARRLLDASLAWAEAKAVRAIYLGTTARFLAAHRFYEKNGFTEIARTELPPEFPIMAVDSKFYMRRF